MAMVKLLIMVPKSIKAKLDALRKEGTTASGFIRSLLERELKTRNRPTFAPNVRRGDCSRSNDSTPAPHR